MSNGNDEEEEEPKVVFPESDEGDVSLTLLLKNAHREMMKGIHTMLPGVIEEFDSGTQRAKITLATAQETLKGEKLSFPPLINVPVQFFRWGSFSLTAPVAAGDECCVIFSERSMALYLQQGQVDTIPNDTRFFDLADAFAIPALNSEGKTVPGYSSANMVMQHDSGTVKLSLTPGGELTIDADDEITITSKKDVTVNSEKDVNVNSSQNIKLSSGGGVGNILEVRSTGGVRSNNTTAELVATIKALMDLINANEVQVEWAATPKSNFVAQLTNLATFLT